MAISTPAAPGYRGDELTVEVPEPVKSRRDELATAPIVGQHLVSLHDATAFIRPSEQDEATTVVVKRVTQGAAVTALCGVLLLAIL